MREIRDQVVESYIADLHERFQELCDILESLTKMVQLNTKRIDYLERHGPATTEEDGEITMAAHKLVALLEDLDYGNLPGRQ